MAQVAPAILVDTHLILWQRVSPSLLRRGERDLLESPSRLHISIVSLWEIAIMMTIGRLRPDDRLLQAPPGFELVDVREEHCAAYAALPMHHRDPFDRMLVAQAGCENLALLTRDRVVQRYHDHARILSFGRA